MRDADHQLLLRNRDQDVLPGTCPTAFSCDPRSEDVEINIGTLQVIKGRLGRRALGLVLDWAEIHQAELLENWSLARQHEALKEIRPLE